MGSAYVRTRSTFPPYPKPPSYISPVLASGLGERALRTEGLLGRLKTDRDERPSSKPDRITDRGGVPWPTLSVCLGTLTGVGFRSTGDWDLPAIPENYTLCLTITTGFPRSQSWIKRVVTRRTAESLTRIMLVLQWLSVLALAAFAAASDAANTDVPELVIDRTYVPTDCTVKSTKGDKIRVHYVSVSFLSVVWWLAVTEPLPDRQTHQRQQV